MILWLVLGGACLFLLLGAGEGFSRARISTLKALLFWIAALGGLTLGTLLLLTGRGAGAIGTLILFGPLAWSWWRQGSPPGIGRGTPPPRASSRAGMSPDEALAVLGLKAGASLAEIKAAHLRLMRGAHPDNGGSDWLATRINQARDTLLRR
jgi:DnaJ family protein C protein 19